MTSAAIAKSASSVAVKRGVATDPDSASASVSTCVTGRSRSTDHTAARTKFTTARGLPAADRTTRRIVGHGRCAYGVYACGCTGCERPAFLTSPTTPTTSAKPGKRPTSIRLPTANPFGHAWRASVSLITTTSGARSSSASVSVRPASSGMPIVLKYDGETPVHIVNGRFASGRSGPSAIRYGATTLTNGGSDIDAAASATPGTASSAGTIRRMNDRIASPSPYFVVG